MKKNEQLKTLEKYDGEVKTTKFLKELGLNQYNIGKFVETGYLERIDRGEYKVQIKKEETRKNDEYILLLIKDLYKCVSDKNFEQTYIIAKHICEDKVDNKFDKVLSLVFNLLYNILGKNYDYSCAKDLKIERKDFTEYERLIYVQDYFAAEKTLNSLVDIMKKNRIIIKDDIIMFQTLVSAAVEKIKSGENIRVRNGLTTKYYRHFIESLREKNHNAALINLDKVISYCDNPSHLKLFNLMREINVSTLEYVKTKKYDFKRKDEYPTNLRDAKTALSDAIMSHDYFYALYLVETYSCGTSNLHKVIKNMLASLLRLTKEMNNYIHFKEEMENKKINAEEEISALDVEEKKEVPDLTLSTKEVAEKNEIVENPVQDIKEEKQEEKQVPKIEVSVEETPKVQSRYNNDEYIRNRKYNVFLTYFQDGDYDFALEYLREILTDDKESNEYKLYELLSSYIEMRDKKSGFTVYDYTYDEESTIDLFNHALLNHDYKVALRNIGKLTYKNDDEILSMMKAILHNMFDLDKKYGVKQKNAEVEEVKSKEEKSQNKEFVRYEYNELLGFVRDKDYDDVLENLKLGFHKRELNRLELNTYRLLEILMWIRNDILKEDYTKKIDFDGNYFKCFFEAIKYHQVDEIIKYYDMCYEHALDKSELDVFGSIIDSIEEEYELLQSKKTEEEKTKQEILRNQSLVVDVNKEIKELLNGKTEISVSEIDTLFTLLDQKCDFDETATYIESCILTMIDVSINNPLIDESYFLDLNDKKIKCDEMDYEELDLSSKSADDTIYTLLLNGDYIRAERLIYEVPFNKCLLKFSFDNRIIIRTLLSILKNTLNKTVDVEKTIDYGSVELKAIQSRIKKNDFLGAFENILSSTHIDKDMLIDIAANTLVSFIGNSIMEQSVVDEFNEALENNDLNALRIAVINYKEVLDRSSYGRVEEYLNKYNNMSKTYEEKKKLKK